MQEAFTIDWLAATSHSLAMPALFHFAYPIDDPLWHEVRASNGYSRAIENRRGTRIMENVHREDMFTHIVYTGKCLLDHQAEENVACDNILNFHVRRGDVITRIDLAIDVYDSALDIGQLYRSLKVGASTTRMRRYSFITDNDNGKTLYLGSRQSEQFVRIYDKAAEQGVGGDWVRIELEVKHDKANMLAIELFSNGLQYAVNRMKTALSYYAQFDSSVWRDIIATVEVKLGAPDKSGTDTELWLLSQVAPAMGRYIRKTGKYNLVEQFLAIVDTFSDDKEGKITDINPTQNLQLLKSELECYGLAINRHIHVGFWMKRGIDYGSSAACTARYDLPE